MRLFISAVLFSGLAFGQSFQGTLRGRVLDPGGASVSGASLTLADEGTSVVRKTVANESGEYVFASVTPATYTVTVEAPGFKKAEQHGVAIATQAAVTVDLKLELGEVSQSVNVVEETPALETADASTGQAIDGKKITDLPILGRNPFFTGKLAQGVVFTGNPKFARMQDQNGNSQVSIAGGPLRTNNYLVDGISVADAVNRAVILPSPEAVGEMKLQASTFDAEVGRTGGGTFNTLLRSGTNEIHGSAVGHLRETPWLANNFFSNRAGLPIANQTFKDWAGSLGGPVVLPKIYNGRNRTFFFITTESYRQLDASTVSLSVPTALEARGDFSQSFTKAGAQQVIYDPLSTQADGTRTPFAGNKIPLSRQSAAGQALASYYPAPNAPTPYFGATNYNVAGSYPNRGDQSTWKADHQFASWFTAAASYIHQKTFEVDYPQVFPNAGTPDQTYCCFRRIDATQANATLTPQPTSVIAIRWGFNRFYSRTTQASAGFDLNSIGLGSTAGLTPNPAFPAVTMGSDAASYGGGGANQDIWYSRSFNVTASKFLGRHSLKAGFDFRTLHDDGTPSSGPTSLSFSDVFTRFRAQSTTAGTGSSVATELLGYPTGGSATLTTNFNDFVRYFGYFAQDDFRVTPKLTLNLGIRFEHESGVQEVNNKLITGFNQTATNPLQQNVTGLAIPGVVQYAGVDGAPTQSGNPLPIKPGPRFGFAYAVDGKTVVRGGYGIFWSPAAFSLQNTLGYSQTTSIVTSTNGNFTPAATLANLYPSGLIQPTGNAAGALSGIGQAITVLNPAAQSGGYVQQYSLDVQRQVPLGFVLKVGFIGSHSLHLLESGQNIDQLNPSYFPLGSALTQSVANPLYGHGGVGSVGTATVSGAQLLLPFPQYTSVTLANSDTGTSLYYSAYFRAERRFANGLSLLASYTWSRSEDDLFAISTAGGAQLTYAAGPQNAYNLQGEWGLSLQDVPNRFTTAITYELPFGKGKPFLGNSRALDLVVGGWSLNAVGTIQSGFPLTVTQPNNNSGIGAAYQRPNATGISPATGGSVDQRINGWINPAAFSQAAQFTFGDISRTLDLRGPGLFNWDISLFKTFSIRERVKAQFRFEALNATNTVEFGTPNTTLTSSTFGLITTQVNNPRLVQLGTRITF